MKAAKEKGKMPAENGRQYKTKTTINTQSSVLVLLLSFYFSSYLLFAGDRGDDKEGGVA